MLTPELADALIDSAAYFVDLGVVLVPLFVGGSLLVALAKEYLPPEKVERKLRGHDEGAGNLAAAGLGAVTPFCSCSTVPVLAGLLQAGAPAGLAFSFLFASPLVNQIAVVLLVGWFGLEVALYYVLVTFTSAVFGGIIVGRLGVTDSIKDVPLVEESNRTVATDGGTTDCGGCACGSSTIERTHSQHFAAAAREAWAFFLETLPYLLMGMTIGALIHGVVPVGMVRTVIGSGNPVAVPLAALAGAPLYVSLSGMLPIAASLGDQGIAIGTVLAFVVGGAGVSVPNLILLNKLFERRLLAIYAGTVVTIAVVVGTAFNVFIA